MDRRSRQNHRRRQTRASSVRFDPLATIIEGSALLGQVARNDQAAIVFDVADPFTAELRLSPTSFGYPIFFMGAGFTKALHPSPERFFSNTSYVMVPVLPYDQLQLDEMLDTYGPYLDVHFEEIARSPRRHLWKHRTEAVRK